MTARRTMLARIAVLWRGDPSEPVPAPSDTRLRRIFEELDARDVATQPVVYADTVVDDVRTRLLQVDGVLVWVDPIMGGRDRSILDAMLRDVVSDGVFVSAHPDVILKMGAKDVLYRTRHLPWGTDTRLYRTGNELREQLPLLLRDSGARVLKQHRGNGGIGVWKVELVREANSDSHVTVRVQHALRGATVEELSLGDFLERCAPYFAGNGCIVDQPYAERLGEGMIRCYLAHDQVVGFGHQLVTALMPPPPGEAGPPPPPPRFYYGPSKPEFQTLKDRLEGGWVAEMQRLLEIDRESLPVIWDADFLLGPKTPAGEDTYILCEINVSSVFPIPDEAPAPLAEAALARVLAAKRERSP